MGDLQNDFLLLLGTYFDKRSSKSFVLIYFGAIWAMRRKHPFSERSIQKEKWYITLHFLEKFEISTPRKEGGGQRKNEIQHLKNIHT